MASLLRHPTAPCRRYKPLESTPRVSPVLDTAMIFQMMIQRAGRTMGHRFPQLRLDGSQVCALPLGGDPVGHSAGDGLGRAEPHRGGRLIVALAEQHIHEVAVPSDRSLEGGPTPLPFPIRFVAIPAAPSLP